MCWVVGVVALCVAGCGSARSAGGSGRSQGQRSSDDAPAVVVVPPPPVDENEGAAIRLLEERGAKIDRDEGGHARIVELVDSQITNDDLRNWAACRSWSRWR